MNDLFDIFTSGFGGSLLGAAGAFAQRYIDNKKEIKVTELKLAQQKEQNLHEIEVLKLNTSAQASLAEYKFAEASMEADKATYVTANSSPWLVLVDVVRGLTRPLLTALLVFYCMGTMYYLSSRYPNVSLTSDQVFGLYSEIISNLVMCTALALSWWFGSRNINGQKGG